MANISKNTMIYVMNNVFENKIRAFILKTCLCLSNKVSIIA